jgi:hypothetical protein
LATPDGKFAFIDAKKQQPYQKARLLSPVQPKSAGSCICFAFLFYKK